MTVARTLLLAALIFGCNTPKPTPTKTTPISASVPVPALSAISSAPSPAPSASCTPAESPRLDPADLKIGPVAQRLSDHSGLWLADERSALLDANPDPAWAEGPVATAWDNSATRAVAVKRLPKALRAWLGRPVKVLGANGAVCETRLQRFLIHAQITPDPRTAEHWEGCADAPPVPAPAIAEQVWAITNKAGRSLIAEFATPCKGALLAVDPDWPMPLIAGPEPASAEVGARAITAFRQLPEYAQLQARFHGEQPEASGSWDDHEARRSISSLVLPGHTPLFVVSVQVGSGCASAGRAQGREFSASLSALWGGGGPAVAIAAIDDRRLAPSAIVDFDGRGDGAILLGPDGPSLARSILRQKKITDKIDVTRFERVFLNSVPFISGPC